MANRVSRECMIQMCNKAKTLGFRPERLMLLDDRITEWSKNEMTPSIAVRVLRHGQVAFEGAYGIMGPGMEPESLTVDAIFPVCSITKPVVSAMLHILQEDGLIDLNDPVRKYIPEFTGDTNKSVHIWHLLTHTSGIIDEDLDKAFKDYVTGTLGMSYPESEATEDIWNELDLKVREKMGLPFMEPGQKMRRNTYMAVCLAAKPTHEPHKLMFYCNNGYELAMEIIKRVSGKRIDEYAAEKLFKPLKMDDSHFIFPREKASRYVTRGEEYVGSNWLNSGVLNSENGAGGLKSTVHDMTRFGQMHLEHGMLDGVRVLSAASVREITSNHNHGLPRAKYDGQLYDSTWGLGWNIKGTKKDDSGMLRSPRSFEHAGFGCCKLLCDPEADIVTAYFTVSKYDNYWNVSHFNNMVISAID